MQMDLISPSESEKIIFLTNVHFSFSYVASL